MSNKAQSNSDDQISGKKIKDPVFSSTGVIYEREELLHLLKTNEHPICVVTGRELTEKPEDVMKNAGSDSNDQISGRKIKDPVFSSTGVIYEREELLHLLKTNEHPICVVTGRELTEKPEDIMKND